MGRINFRRLSASITARWAVIRNEARARPCGRQRDVMLKRAHELVSPFLVAWGILLLGGSAVQAETWRCTKPDGSVVYSDQNLSGRCQLLEDLPPLLRVPSVVPSQPGEANPEAPSPAPPEPEEVPTPGRGRRNDPPSDAAIMYALLGQELRVQNIDP